MKHLTPMIMLAIKIISICSIFLNVDGGKLYNNLAESYLKFLKKEELNTEKYIHFICIKKNEYFISELFDKSDLKCNNIIKQFVYNGHYFIVIDNDCKFTKSVILDSKYKAANDDTKRGETMLFDPIVVKVTFVNNKINALILETDYDLLKVCK